MGEKSIHYHSGIYRFQWPYLSAYLGVNEDNEVTVYNCDVELRVGQQQDMEEGKLVTVVITAQPGTPGIQSSIENIATKIRIAFFDNIFIEKHWESTIVPENRIRWIERHLFSQYPNSYMTDEVKEVTMNWDTKRHVYSSPSWTDIAKG